MQLLYLVLLHINFNKTWKYNKFILLNFYSRNVNLDLV